MTLAARKHSTLAVKLSGLRDELVDWRDRADRDGTPLARHLSQIQAITQPLDGAARELEAALGRICGADGDVIEGCAAVQVALLDLERAWEFFRSKLAQRLVEPLSAYLLVADELAWECCRPVRAVAESVVREPPLTYLNGGSSPFMSARGMAYATAMPDGGIRNARVEDLVGALPVAVIGLPWDHLHHVPDVAVVAHEVGHVVDEDCGLGAALEGVIAAAVDDDERRSGWCAWAAEAFADAFGAATLGPAYLASLTEFVAARPTAITMARPLPNAWGAYPTATLRVLLCAVVAQRWDRAATDGLVAEWRSSYPEHAMAAWEADATAVGVALVATPLAALGGQSIEALVGFGTGRAAAATADGKRMLRRGTPIAREARTLVAAGHEAFRSDAGGYQEQDVAGAVLAAIETAAPHRRRGTPRGAGAAMAAEAQRQVDAAVSALFPEISQL